MIPFLYALMVPLEAAIPYEHEPGKEPRACGHLRQWTGWWIYGWGRSGLTGVHTLFSFPGNESGGSQAVPFRKRTAEGIPDGETGGQQRVEMAALGSSPIARRAVSNFSGWNSGLPAQGRRGLAEFGHGSSHLAFARDAKDVLVMKNGDRITCEVKGLQAGSSRSISLC